MKQYLLKILKLSISIITVVIMISVWMDISYFVVKKGMEFFLDGDIAGIDTTENTNEGCNVYGINLHGDVVTYHSPESYNNDKLIVDETSSEEVMYIVKDAEQNDSIKAVVVEIASAGGSPVAGWEMMSSFKNIKKPVVAFVRDGAMSAAYLAATGAKTIFAATSSDIGSIGVTASYLENVDKNKKEGLKYIDLSVGKYKDTMNPDRPLSNEEKQLLMRDINLLHENFIKSVAENRKLDINKVRLLADGSTLMGEAALKAGLIDKIGNIYDVENYLTDEMGEEANICWQN